MELIFTSDISQEINKEMKMKTAHIITDMQKGYIVKFYIDNKITSVAEFSHWALAFKFAWKWKNNVVDKIHLQNIKKLLHVSHHTPGVKNCGDIDEEMIELRKLLNWIDNLRVGHFGFTTKADSGFSNDLDKSLNIIENLIQDWNS